MSARRSARLEGVNNYSPALKAWIAEVLAGVDKGGAASLAHPGAGAAAAASSTGPSAAEIKGWCVFGGRTLDERNAEGFAKAYAKAIVRDEHHVTCAICKETTFITCYEQMKDRHLFCSCGAVACKMCADSLYGWNVCSLHGGTCPKCYRLGDCCEKEMQELDPYNPHEYLGM